MAIFGNFFIAYIPVILHSACWIFQNTLFPFPMKLFQRSYGHFNEHYPFFETPCTRFSADEILPSCPPQSAAWRQLDTMHQWIRIQFEILAVSCTAFCNAPTKTTFVEIVKWRCSSELSPDPIPWPWRLGLDMWRWRAKAKQCSKSLLKKPNAMILDINECVEEGTVVPYNRIGVG